MTNCCITKEAAKKEEFRKKLQSLLNEYSFEDGSNTPDYVLSTYLMDCIETFNRATLRRDSHYGGLSKPEAKIDRYPQYLQGTIIAGDIPHFVGS